MDISALLLDLSLMYERELGYDFLLLNLKASVVILLALFFSRQLQDSSAAYRQLIPAIALTLVLILPALTLVLPVLRLEMLPNAAGAFDLSPALELTPQDEAGRAEQLNRWWFYLAAIYTTGVLFLAARILVRWLRMRTFLAAAKACDNGQWLGRAQRLQEQLGITRRVTLLRSDDFATPVTLGLWRPVVILPPQAEHWSRQMLDSALAHELAHVKRLDWLWLNIAHFACLLFWWLPGIWALKRRLHRESELAADDLVLQLGIKASSYAEQLLALVSRPGKANNMVMALANRAELYQRIKALLDWRTNRDPVGKCAAIVVFSISLLSTAVLASIEAAAISEATPAVRGWLAKSTQPLRIIFRGTAAGPSNATAQDADDPRSGHPYIARHKPFEPSARAQIPALRPDMESLTGTRLTPPNIARPELKVADLGLATAPMVPMKPMQAYELVPIEQVTPAYPAKAKRRNIEGYVLVRFDLSAEGRPENIHILEARPAQIFEHSVARALTQSRYRPYRLSGHAVRVEGLVSRYRFRLTPAEEFAAPQPAADESFSAGSPHEEAVSVLAILDSS